MRPVVEAAGALNGERPLQVLEIGSWAGASAVSWAVAVQSLAQKGRVLCVDTWKPYFDLTVEKDAIYAEMNAAAEGGDVLRLFLHNVRAAGVADLVDHRVGASREILPQLEPASFDIIYVDGSHAAEDVLCDLSQATRLIRDGGIVCGDDLELQRDSVDASEHTAALTSGRDFMWAESAGTHYHPGVTEAVARLLGPVFTWNGFWTARRRRIVWEPFEFEPGALPVHIGNALRESDTGHEWQDKQPELVEETAAYNLVRVGPRYLAIAKQVGPVALGEEKFGERDLPPYVLVSPSLELLRPKVAVHDRQAAAPQLVHGTEKYNLVRYGSKYLAVAKMLGSVDLGKERLGERELPPYLYIGSSISELLTRIAMPCP